MVDMAHFAGLVAAERAPEPGPPRRRRHDDDPQDHRRRARRHDPLPRGVRQEDQLGGLPRPAGRAADARDRRQGRLAEDRPVASCSASASGARARARRSSPRSCSAPASTCSPAAPTCTSCSPTCASPSSTASRPRTASTRSASPSTATRCRSTRARRRCHSGLRIGTPALATRGFQADDFREIGKVIAEALTGDFEDARATLASAPARSPSATRCTRSSPSPPRSRQARRSDRPHRSS